MYSQLNNEIHILIARYIYSSKQNCLEILEYKLVNLKFFTCRSSNRESSPSYLFPLYISAFSSPTVPVKPRTHALVDHAYGRNVVGRGVKWTKAYIMVQ